MHELGIAQAALKHVLAQAGPGETKRIDCIALRIGALSGVDPEALRFAFEAILPSSAATVARPELESIPPLARCQCFGYEYSPTTETLFECPRCHAFGAELLQGRELDLVRID